MSNSYIYIDNAATSFPKPASVSKAMLRVLENVGGSPGRGGHKNAIAAARILYEAREALADFLHLPHPERIVFTKNGTEGINLALFGLMKPGMRVATSGIEHNAVVRPLAALSSRGVEMVTPPLDGNGLPIADQLPPVDGLMVTAASNVTGAVADIQGLGNACRKNHSIFMIDAAQAAGSIPLDLTHADVVAAPGHKGLLGPQGIGFVWFSTRVDPAPLFFGGTGSESTSALMPPYWPDRFEAGTPNVAGVAGLAAGVAYLAKKGIAAVREKEQALSTMILDRFTDDSRISIYPPFDADDRASLITFTVAGIDPATVAEKLDREGIAVRAGLHCAPAAHQWIGTFPHGGVRVSPGIMTTRKEITRFLAVMDAIAGGKK